MRNQFEKSPEASKEWADTIPISDIAIYSGLSLPELKNQAVNTLLQQLNEGKREERLLRRDFQLDDKLPIEQALQEKAESILIEFERQLPEKKEKFQEQLQHCIALATERGYLQQPPQPFSILITHEFLQTGSDYKRGKQYINYFDHDQHIIPITIDSPNILLAHEIGHALSTNDGEKRSGFQTLKKEGSQTVTRGNQWFNEGMTVIWENQSASDNEKITQREEEGDFYSWYHQAAELLLKEINVSEDDNLKAYFGNSEMISKLRQKIQKRFNCTLEDLACLSYKIDINWTKQVISGQPVEINISRQTYARIKNKLTKLTQIFPNVTVNQK